MTTFLLSRRTVLQGFGLSLSGLTFHAESHGAQEGCTCLVFVSLRGGLDGLNAVIPYLDSRYYQLRPGIALAAPHARTASAHSKALPLESGYGLHPALADLLPAFRSKELAIVHAVGTRDGSRSHFQAQDAMEMGCTPDEHSDGWLARLSSLLTPSSALLHAVSFGGGLSTALRGIPHPVVVADLETFSVRNLRGINNLQDVLERNYRHAQGPAAGAGRRALQAIGQLRAISERIPSSAGEYPHHLRPLSELARLIRADVGLRLATVNIGGWDTHSRQGGATGLLAKNLSHMASGLATFRRDLGENGQRVVVVAATEFGRTAAQNASGGTDHGRGSILLVMGGDVRGGKVYGDFPGLKEDQLENGRDLAVTTDLRTVFAEVSERVLHRRLSATEADALLPGFSPTRRLGLFGAS